MSQNHRSGASGVLLLALLGVFEVTGVAFGQTIDPSALTGRKAASDFLKTHAGDAFEDAALGDFRVLDLDQDGRVDLLATVDYSGRSFFNHLLVLHDTGHGLAVQEIDVWNLESLDGVVRDIDKDEVPELLLRRSLTPYLGTRPMASWSAVYGLDGEELVDKSAQYPQFYASILARLDRELAADSPAHSSGEDYAIETRAIERDKILRVLGQFSDAGLASAARWSQSDDPVLRIFAVAVFSEIDGSEAVAALRALSKDVDPEVAAIARVADLVKRGVQ